MPRTAVKEAINEVQSQSVGEYPDPSTEPNPTPDPDPSIPNELKGRLMDARVKMKNATKDYVLAGIGDALEEISSGDLGDITHLIDAVEVFSERVTAPKSPRAIAKSPSSLFALPQAN